MNARAATPIGTGRKITLGFAALFLQNDLNRIPLHLIGA
jgi:hypothetical protein